MKICVFGATGLTGNAIVREALDRGHSVVAPVRTPEKIVLKHDNLETVKNDVLDLPSIELLAKGALCDHVIISIGSKELRNNNVRSKGTENILQAIKNNGKSPRVWVISAAGTGNSMSQLGFFNRVIIRTILGAVIKEHELQENMVKESSFPYTILRPTGLTTDPATGNYELKERGKLASSKISREDIAGCIVDQLGKPDLVNKAVCITGIKV